MKKSVRLSFYLAVLLLSTSHVVLAQSFSWQRFSIPSVTSGINAIATKSNGTIFAGTDLNGIYRSTDKGTSWTRLDTGQAMWLSLNPATGLRETTMVGMQHSFYSLAVNNAGDVFAGSYVGRIYRSTDNGASWKLILMRTGNDSIPSIITSFAFDNGGTMFVGTGGRGLFRSPDNGNTWDEMTLGTTSPYVSSIIIDQHGTVFIGTHGGGIYRSGNGGLTWHSENVGLYRVNCFALGVNGQTIAGTDAGIFRDSARIDTTSQSPLKLDTVHIGWTQNLNGITNRAFVLSLASTASGHVFAGVISRTATGALREGIYRSTNNGASWLSANSGLTDTLISSFAINDSGYVFAGSLHGNVYRGTQLEQAARPKEVLQSVTTTALERNYPNPFNPMTTIPFTVDRASYVSLVVYDAIGRKVTTLVDGMLSSGRHEVQWNAGNIPSGIYFYRFQTQATAQTGKLMLLK